MPRRYHVDLDRAGQQPLDLLLLDDGNAALHVGYVMPSVSSDPSRYIDLSQFDFEALKERFDKGRKNIEAQKLRATLAVKCVFQRCRSLIPI